jgi:hypothetical protein
VKAFDAGNFAAFLEQFFKAIHSRYDIEKPVVQRFIRKKLKHHQPASRRKQRIEGADGATKARMRSLHKSTTRWGMNASPWLMTFAPHWLITTKLSICTPNIC